MSGGSCWHVGIKQQARGRVLTRRADEVTWNTDDDASASLTGGTTLVLLVFPIPRVVAGACFYFKEVGPAHPSVAYHDDDACLRLPGTGGTHWRACMASFVVVLPTFRARRGRRRTKRPHLNECWIFLKKKNLLRLFLFGVGRGRVLYYVLSSRVTSSPVAWIC